MFSCSEKLDFSQLEDYRITPEYTVSLTYFKITPIQFFNATGVQESERTDITDFRIFENSFSRNNLVKIDFHVKVKNQINKDFTMQVEFLDENRNLTYKFQDIDVSANNLNFDFTETIDVTSNANVKNTSKVKILVKINNTNPPLNPLDTSEFEFKSSAKIYIDTGD
jgi:hypothetical protein